MTGGNEYLSWDQSSEALTSAVSDPDKAVKEAIDERLDDETVEKW